MLLPKRVKYRRVHRGRMTGKATRGNFVSNGEFGIQATEPCWITSNQIEAARIAMTRYTKRGGQVWIKIFPDKPVTKHPAGARMGSGKGAPEYWVAVVKPGRVSVIFYSPFSIWKGQKNAQHCYHWWRTGGTECCDLRGTRRYAGNRSV